MQNITTYAILDEWYSWIPTNLGKLNFAYIGDTSNLQKVFGHNSFQIEEVSESKKRIQLSNTNLSDLNAINKFINRIIEVKDSASIEIEEKNEILEGVIVINYNKKVEINSTFTIESSGKIEIKNVKVKYDKNQVNNVKKTDILDTTIVTAIYTILKKIIHGDNHHEQKIDTFIGVYKEKFDAGKILDSFAKSIKSRERVVKDTTQNNCYYKQQKILSAIEVDGYISYIETFYLLFKTDENKEVLKEKIDYIKNVVKSLKASVEKIKFGIDLNQKHITLLMTFVAFVVSINIFHNGLYDIKTDIEISDKISYITNSFFIVVFMYVVAVRKVCYSYYISHIEVFWEYIRYQALKEKNYLSALILFIASTVIVFLALKIVKMILTFLVVKTLFS